jgi:uncharacterized Zn finger protein (UPF0148 family)
MEKYGVDESLGDKKTAEMSLDVCPVCGARLHKHGQVVLCPIHGSKPFEYDSNKEK